MNFVITGVEDVVESTRLNGTDQSMLRPNVTDRNISDIPRTSSIEATGNTSTSESAAATEEAQTPEEINAELSAAISDLDISDHEQANDLEVKSNATEQPLVSKENHPDNDDVFNPAPQTPQQIAEALSAAVGEETLDHDRSNLEANFLLGGSAMMSAKVDLLESSDSLSSRSASSQQGGRKSTRSSARSSKDEANVTGSHRSSTTDGRGSNTSRSSQSSARSLTKSETGELTCDQCNKKCKNKSGFKSHMKTHKS